MTMSHSDNVLALADGSAWQITGRDEGASVILSSLKEILQLRSFNGPCRRLILTTGDRRAFVPDTAPDGLEISLPLLDDADYSPGAVFAQAMRPVCRDLQSRGGLFIHGAVAERDGLGVIMAGVSGIGKTTACSRLPSPWRCRSDDKALVVRDREGHYWAHPWPTWSRFRRSGTGGSWEVSRAVALEGLFFLAQAPEDRVEPIKTGHAACMLVETCQEAAFLSLELGDTGEGLRMQRLKRFDSICELVKSIPSFMLHVSVTGSFWNEIDAVLDQ